jgi:hypothetical protein
MEVWRKMGSVFFDIKNNQGSNQRKKCKVGWIIHTPPVCSHASWCIDCNASRLRSSVKPVGRGILPPLSLRGLGVDEVELRLLSLADRFNELDEEALSLLLVVETGCVGGRGVCEKVAINSSSSSLEFMLRNWWSSAICTSRGDECRARLPLDELAVGVLFCRPRKCWEST